MSPLECSWLEVTLASSHGISTNNSQAKYRQTNIVHDRPRLGQPRKTKPREDRYIVTSSRRNRMMPCTSLVERLLHATGTRISVHTARKRLRAAGLHARCPYVGVPLTRRLRVARNNWARVHMQWTKQQWSRMLFTDESRFRLQMADGRVRVWKPKGERFDPPIVVERDTFGGGSVMIWSGISPAGLTRLFTINENLTAVRYRDEVVTSWHRITSITSGTTWDVQFYFFYEEQYYQTFKFYWLNFFFWYILINTLRTAHELCINLICI